MMDKDYKAIALAYPILDKSRVIHSIIEADDDMYVFGYEGFSNAEVVVDLKKESAEKVATAIAMGLLADTKKYRKVDMDKLKTYKQKFLN